MPASKDRPPTKRLGYRWEFRDCPCSACWPDDDEDYDGDDFICEPVNVGDELHQILADALHKAALKTAKREDTQ